MNEDQLPFSITTARKLLGKASWGLSDEEVQQQIEVAQMLRDIFFNAQIYQNIQFQKGGAEQSK